MTPPINPTLQSRLRQATGADDLVTRGVAASSKVWDEWPDPITLENIAEVRAAAARAVLALGMEAAIDRVDFSIRYFDQSAVANGVSKTHAQACRIALKDARDAIRAKAASLKGAPE